MRRDNELESRQRRGQLADDRTLPGWMEVQINIVNQDNSAEVN
jgi:hypothetical protein